MLHNVVVLLFLSRHFLYCCQSFVLPVLPFHSSFLSLPSVPVLLSVIYPPHPSLPPIPFDLPKVFAVYLSRIVSLSLGPCTSTSLSGIRAAVPWISNLTLWRNRWTAAKLAPKTLVSSVAASMPPTSTTFQVCFRDIVISTPKYKSVGLSSSLFRWLAYPAVLTFNSD